MTSSPVLQVRNLEMHFPIKKGLFGKVAGSVRAVNGVSFDIHQGECLGLVGESGCGKTTIGRCILRAYQPSGGAIHYTNPHGDSTNLVPMNKAQLRSVRREIQMIFQDPNASLNPRMPVVDIVGEPLLCSGMKDRKQREERVRDLMHLVGLRPSHMQRYPHAFSGGQRQRIGIARALALQPRLIVGDEPVSALDVSVQAQVLNLLQDLRKNLGLTYLFISHDLSVVRHICDRIAVMYAGRIVEMAPTAELFNRPRHPYTAALLSAIPQAHARQRTQRVILRGEVTDPANLPSGCAFHPRCPFATEVCQREQPSLEAATQQHSVACLRQHELSQDELTHGKPTAPSAANAAHAALSP